MKDREYKTMFNFEDSYWWYVGLHNLILGFIKKYSNNSYEKSIFDAGCGTGKMLKLLKNYKYTEGIDLSENAIEFSKSRGLINVSVGNINSWKAAIKFDFIISADVMCCTGIKDDLKICLNFNESLNKAGVLILNLPALNILGRKHDKAVFIAKRYKRREFIKVLKNAGFKIDIATYRLPFLFFIILIKKIFESFSREYDYKSDLKALPVIINNFFLALHKIENFLIRLGLRFPFGSSLFIIAQKNG